MFSKSVLISKSTKKTLLKNLKSPRKKVRVAFTQKKVSLKNELKNGHGKLQIANQTQKQPDYSELRKKFKTPNAKYNHKIVPNRRSKLNQKNRHKPLQTKYSKSFFEKS